MAGKNVPIVLIPRYTSYVGGGVYTTPPIPVSAYESLVVSMWRSAGIGTMPTVGFFWRESNDLVDFEACTGGISSAPVATETQSTVQLSKAWFQLSVVLNPADAAMTFWCQGFLILREK
jgi:hypothetical protein